MQLYRLGDRGPAVADVQGTLVGLGLLARAPADAVFDAATDVALREFQQRRGLSVDGTVGAETYRALAAARWSLGDRLLSLATNPFVGDDVAALQERLLELGFDAGRADGVLGPRTERALRGLQREYGLVPDGTCGPETLRALRQLGRKVTGGRPQVLREAEALHRSGAALPGKVVVLDPGHGADDRGASGHGLQEAAVVEDLAARLEGRLTALGVRALLTRGPDTCPTDAQRAAVRQRRRRRPGAVAARRPRRLASLPRRRDLPLRGRTRHHVDRRRSSSRRWSSARSSRGPTCSTVACTRRRGRCCG